MYKLKKKAQFVIFHYEYSFFFLAKAVGTVGCKKGVEIVFYGD